MARQKPQDVAEELQKLDDQVYGESTVSGSAPALESDDDVLKNLEDVIGEEPDQNPWGFNIGDASNEDAQAIAHGKPEGDTPDDLEEAEDDEVDDLLEEDDTLSINGLEEIEESESEEDEENQ